MSKINIFSLGGLNENGKNMYVVCVDDDILVLEAGLQYADEQTLGIDYMIPNIDYLKQNKERIRGIFLTHGHDENVGAITDIIDYLPNIPIYASPFTYNIVKQELLEYDKSISSLVKIEANKPVDVGNLKVYPVSLSHSIPDNFGYAIYTPDGIIFYASDFVFDSTMRGAYKTDLGKLAYIGKQGVLCLMSESLYANKEGYTAPNHRIQSLIRETLVKSNGRIIFNVLNSHLYRIQELFNEVEKTDRKIVVMGKRLQNIIDNAIKEDYLHIDSKYIGDLSNINDENVVILNSNERYKPYYNILKIVDGYDKYVTLTSSDTVFLATPVYEGREKTFYKLLDKIAKIGCEAVVLSPKKYLSYHASKEDLMMMIELMNPKYYFPIKGEYSEQVANGDLACMVGVDKDNIILKENGSVATIVDGKLMDEFKEVRVGNISIDGDSSNDIGELVLKDRELLSNNGIVIVSATIDKKSKQIIAGPEILTRGFIYVKDSVQLIDDMKNICSSIILDNTHNGYVDYTKIKNTIRDELSKFLFEQAGNKPMIINVIQEI
ncbi:MAG: ribonuclease J [Bacilli bacterium]|jgi:ribonuclease J|nr:ribonuclease J [Clostridium sp.]MDY3798527.1 ribonuclease J [Bacilli bacterium]CDE95346.1 beta-lactamase domain protein [Clostridium sp. CAG:914]